jgi:iron complex transport system substrate-binding protein
MPVARIVSLLPSSTEIVHALGLGARLVGRSHECDFPPEVASLPVCTAPRFDPRGSSAEIDTRVKDLVRDGLSVYRVDAERLRELEPDLVLTQSQCEVCAVSEEDVSAALADWLGARPRVLSLAPRRLADVLGDVVRVAAAAGASAAGRRVSEALEGRIAALAERALRLRSRPRLACLEWTDPPMGSGHWMPELVTLAGGEAVLGGPGEPAAWTRMEELRALDPECILLVPCGFGLERAAAELATLARLPGFGELRAVRTASVYAADGNAFFNRPGPRLVESLEILAEILHPEEFSFGHAGRAWRRLG